MFVSCAEHSMFLHFHEKLVMDGKLSQKYSRLKILQSTTSDHNSSKLVNNSRN